MFTVSAILGLLKVVPAAVAAAPEFISTFNTIVDSFDDDADQDTLKQGYADLMQDNDEGFARLDALLAEAEKR
mgnify:CR=1 FL=1